MPTVINLPGDLVSSKTIEGLEITNAEATATETYREQMIEAQHRIEGLLRIIINHQRIITGIETNEEGVL